VSAALEQRRREWAAAARAEAAGLTPDQYRVALLTACVAWGARGPWCWLPTWVRDRTFELFGRRMAARFVEGWARSEAEHVD
jgi:hypothetical protein